MALKKLSREMVINEYVNKEVSISQAAKNLGCSHTTLVKAIKEYGLPKKPKTWNRRRKNRFPQLQDREWLEEQLKTRTMLDIAKELGTSSGNVSDHVKRHGLRWKHYDRIEAVREGLKKAFPNGRSGSAASNWKGGRQITAGGHVYIHRPDHPSANKQGYVMEHRLVMEEHIRRYLTIDEVVHHKNEDKLDNRIENLELMTVEEHRSYHLTASKQIPKFKERIIYLEALLKENGIQFE